MATPTRTDTPRRRWLLRVFGALAAALVLGGAYLFIYEPEYRGTLVSTAPRTMVFAHRGFGELGPDNSLFAVERALEAGMDGVDVDGQMTRDGVLVIFHDLSVDRLTSGTGPVRDKTAAEMLALDLGPKYDHKTGDAFVRTFEDFVRTVKGHGTLMVELKVPGAGSTGIEEQAVGIVQKLGAHDTVILSSFNPLVLYRVKRLDPRIRTCFIFMDTNWNAELLAEIKPEDRVDLPWFLQQEFIRRAIRKIVMPDLLSINHDVDQRVIDGLIAKGWPVFIWTIDEEPAIRAALARRPWGIISDQPVRAKTLRGE
jgi:glycerophosphoryl diester phosphodiesterase